MTKLKKLAWLTISFFITIIFKTDIASAASNSYYNATYIKTTTNGVRIQISTTDTVCSAETVGHRCNGTVTSYLTMLEAALENDLIEAEGCGVGKYWSSCGCADDRSSDCCNTLTDTSRLKCSPCPQNGTTATAGAFSYIGHEIKGNTAGGSFCCHIDPFGNNITSNGDSINQTSYYFTIDILGGIFPKKTIEDCYIPKGPVYGDRYGSYDFVSSCYY